MRIAVLFCITVWTLLFCAVYTAIQSYHAAQYKARYSDSVTVAINGSDFNNRDCMVLYKGDHAEPRYRVGPCK